MNYSDNLFVKWNLRLLTEYFTPASIGQEVWLQTTPADLDAIGPDLGGDEGFLNAIKHGPPWHKPLTEANFVQFFRLLAEEHNNPRMRPDDYIDPADLTGIYRNYNPPAYLPYLGLLVRSAASSENGFYAHVSKSLNINLPIWTPVQIDAVWGLWDDLQKWTTMRSIGKFGLFKKRILGGYPYIGVPKSQCILTKRDFELAPRLFKQIGLLPGREFTQNHFFALRNYAGSATYLSRGFRNAVENNAFKEPTYEMLKSSYEDWDGKLPKRDQALDNGGDKSGYKPQESEIELCLGISDHADNWNIHWRAPANREYGRLTISQDENLWEAQLSGSEKVTVFDKIPNTNQLASLQILENSEKESVRFQMFVSEDFSDVRVSVGCAFLQNKLLRVLVWEQDVVTQKNELRERSLPLFGCAYILVSKSNKVRFEKYLEINKKISTQVITLEGLPDDWTLICIEKCEELDDEARNTLPDGSDNLNMTRMISFKGGGVVSRAGSRQYMPYDLPWLELDAPIGTEIKATGLNFIEEKRNIEICDENNVVQNFKSQIRRFNIFIENNANRFEIIAFNKNSKIGNASLKISSTYGDYIDLENEISLDLFGDAQGSSEGLRGVLNIDNEVMFESKFEINPNVLGVKIKESDFDMISNNPSAQFLDSLAQKGTITISIARDQLSRLINLKAGNSELTPYDILWDLRARGYLELETNLKGNYVRVHAVPAMVVELPLKCAGKCIFGVIGSLRLENWRAIFEDTVNIQSYKSQAIPGFLPSYKIMTSIVGKSNEYFNKIGFKYCLGSSAAIAHWMGSLVEAKAKVHQYGGRESFGSSNQLVEKFNPGSAQFANSNFGCVLSAGPKIQLFKVEDLDVKNRQLYILGAKAIDQATYGFVRDSRWGVWSAMSSFAEFVSATYQRDDVKPWPISYNAKLGCLYLPARLRPPAVIERALTLCSGSGPEIVKVKSQMNENGINLVRDSNEEFVAQVSSVYQDIAEGRWALYKWVPRDIAVIIATKLGCKIVDY